MLTLTENASALIKNLTDETGVAEHAGLRISTTEDSTGLAVEVIPEPKPHDHVVEASGVRVFLDERAAIVLTDKVLDAHRDQGGAVTFAIEPKH